MSQNSNNLHTISEINTNSIHNHVTNESTLKNIFVADNVLNGTGILKRINSSSQIRVNQFEIHNSRPQKFNSISKIKRVIKAKEIENEPLVLVKNTTNYNALQIAIIEKLKDEKYKQEELINDLIELIEKCPIINKFTDMRLFKKEDFDIFIETNDEKFLFILNLHNMMNIVNLLWFYSKKNSEHFLNLLDKLGIYFSYVKRKEDPNSKIIDVVLLTKIPLNLYNYISNYSDREFDNTKLKGMAKSFSKYGDKYIEDLGFCYQDLTIMNILNQLEDNQFSLNDEIIYYFNQEEAEKIINNDFIEAPDHYKLSSSIKTQGSTIETNEKPFQGYNEIDLCLTMLEDVALEKNDNFNYIDSKNEEKNDIVLKKGTTYIFEIKTNIKNIIKGFANIEKHKKRFIEAYNNICIINKKKYNIQNSELILICNRNRKSAKKKILDNEQEIYKEDDKKKFIFSGPQIGVGFALKFQRDIKNLKKESSSLKEAFDNLAKDYKTSKEGVDNLTTENSTLKDKILDLKKEIIKMKESRYQNLLISLEFSDVEPISKVLSTKKIKINQKFNLIYNTFNFLCDSIVGLKSNLLYHDISPFLGKNIENLEYKNKWNAIKAKLIEKINKNNSLSIYYEGLLELFFGLKHLKENKPIVYDIFSGEKQRFIILLEQLILFTEIFENNINVRDIEIKYQGAALYIMNNCIEKEFIKRVIEEKLDSRETIKKIISICNNENYLYYYPK